jgi:hypothetical protein
MSLYESFLLLNMFRMLLHSSSGAGDYVGVLLCFGVYWCIGAVRLEWGGIRVQVGVLLVCACGVEWTGVNWGGVCVCVCVWGGVDGG